MRIAVGCGEKARRVRTVWWSALAVICPWPARVEEEETSQGRSQAECRRVEVAAQQAIEKQSNAHANSLRSEPSHRTVSEGGSLFAPAGLITEGQLDAAG